MKITWVLIANATQARCYTRERANTPLTEVAGFEDAWGRAKGSDLTEDRAGYEGTSLTRGGATYSPRLPAKKKEHEGFARRLASFLNQAVVDRRCEELVIFASNPFLGELKSFLNAHANQALGRTLPIDLTSFTGAELSRRIQEHLLPPR